MLRKILFLTAMLFSLYLQAEAQVSANIEKTEDNPFGNVSFVDGVYGKANALQIDGNKLYLGMDNTLYIYDIQTPAKPSLCGSIVLEGLCRQIVVKDDIAFVACRESGVWIINAKTPENPRLITRYDTVELATGIDVYGDVMFIAERINGVEFVDISDISHPEHIRLLKTPESQSVWYQDGVLYSGEWGKHEITAIRASDMSAIKLLSKTQLWGNGDGLFAQNGLLYAATGHHSYDPALSKEDNYGNGHSLQIFDISDPARPELLSTTGFAKLYSRGNDYWTARPCGNGKIAFVADTFNGLYAVDTRKAVSVGHVTFQNEKGKDLAVTSLAIGKGVVYVSVFNGGLAVVECKKAVPARADKGIEPVNADYRYNYKNAEPSCFMNWRPGGRYPVRSVAVRGDFVYVACSNGGLAILKMDASGSVRLVGTGPQTFVEDVKIRNGKLYSAEGRDGIGIYNIVEDVKLEEIDRIKDIGNGSPFCLWLEVPNDDCIIASPRGPYYWIDAKNPHGKGATEFLASSAGWDRFVPNSVFAGNMFAHARPHLGLVWMDFSSGRPQIGKPTKKIIVNQRSGISNYKGGKAVVIIKKKMYVLTPGDNDLPDTGVDLGVDGAPMWDGAAQLAVTNRVGRNITILDVSSEAFPKTVLSEKTSGQPEMPVFHNGKLLVPCGYQGLLIQR